MKDSLQLFNQVINNRWLEKTNVILFLNKTDLFAQRVESELDAFTACFPRFRPPAEKLTEAALVCVKVAEFFLLLLLLFILLLQEAFLAEEKTPGQRILYSYETCATDTACVQRVFEAVSGISHVVLSLVAEQQAIDIFLTKNLESFI